MRLSAAKMHEVGSGPSSLLLYFVNSVSLCRRPRLLNASSCQAFMDLIRGSIYNRRRRNQTRINRKCSAAHLLTLVYSTKKLEHRCLFCWKCLSKVIIYFVFYLKEKGHFLESRLVKSSGQSRRNSPQTRSLYACFTCA